MPFGRGAISLITFAALAAPSAPLGAATLKLIRGAQLWCGSTAGATVWLYNTSGVAQVVPSGTELDFTFSAPVIAGPTVPPGATVTFSDRTAVVKFVSDYTVPADAGVGFLSTSVDLTSVPDLAPVFVSIAVKPAQAVVFSDQVSGAIVGIRDERACAPRASFGVDDLIATCPSASEVDAFNAKTALAFDADPTSGVLVCRAANGSVDLTRLQERTYQALRLMQIIPFDSGLPWTSASLYDWFTSAARGIRFRGDITYSFCCDPAGVINVQTNNLGAVQFTTGEWLATLMTLFAHEARHSDGPGHTCGSSDQTLSEVGAWGVQYYLEEYMALRSGLFFTPHATDATPGYYRNWLFDDAQSMFAWRFCDLGSGVAPSPRKVEFGTEMVGRMSSPRLVAFTATKDAPVAPVTTTLSSVNSDDFQVQQGRCVGGTCTVLVSFQPKEQGIRTATLTAADEAVELSGTGGQPPCSFRLSRNSEIRPPASGSGSVNVDAPPGCTWRATSTAGWLSLTSGASGRGAGQVKYSVEANTGSAARQATLSVAGLTFAVAQAGLASAWTPSFTSDGVTNAASFLQGATPGSLATIFGSYLTTAVADIAQAEALPLPKSLAGTRVLINDIEAPILAIANVNGREQINLQVPWELAGTPAAPIVADNNGARSRAVIVNFPSARPGLFTWGGNLAATLHFCSDGVRFCPVTESDPAKRGEAILLYGTGLGPVANAPVTGAPAPAAEPLARTVEIPEVTIGGIKETVEYSGLAPYFVGLYQINVRLSADVPHGRVSLNLVIAGQAAKEAFIFID